MITVNASLLAGKHVYLNLLSPADSETLRRLAKDERIWEFTKAFAIHDNFDRQFDQYMATAFNNDAMGGQRVFTIRQRENDEIIGMTRYYEIKPTDKRLAIGYTWYIPKVWGSVHNKECKLLLLQYAFEELGYQRVEFHVAHQNIRSQKAVEKIGGTKEGVLRKYGIRNDGSMRHTVVFSIIDEEWPAVKEKLQTLIAATQNP